MPEICLLGTGGMLPLKNRFLTSLYVEHNGKAIMIDCGEGTQVAMGMHGLKMSRIEALMITHSHADHVTGLPGLLLSIGNCSRMLPLDIYFPESCEQTVVNLLSVCGGLPYPVRLHGLPENEPSEFTVDKIDTMLRVNTLPLSHGVPCIGYSLSFNKKPVFNPEKAKKLGVPVKYWKTLHAGGEVTLSDGTTVTTAEVTDSARKSVKITYTTDTLPVPEIADFARNSDLFVCEGMYGDTEKKASMNAKGHMLMQDACRLAAESDSGLLWLTHYSPAETEPYAYENELKEIFPDVVISRDGQKIVL